MSSNRVNEFLPPSATPDRMDTGNANEPEGDIGYLQVLKNENVGELKRLDEEHHQKQMQLEQQAQAGTQQIFSLFQREYQDLRGSIQQVHENLRQVQDRVEQAFTGLQESLTNNISTQVELRLQQHRLREEHAASTIAAENQYRHKLTQWIDRQHSTRAPNHYGQAARESLTPKLFNVPLSSGGNGSPATQSESARTSMPPVIPIPQDTPTEKRRLPEGVAQPAIATQHMPHGSVPHQQLPAAQQPLPERPLSQQPDAPRPLAAEPVAPESVLAQRSAERPRGSLHPGVQPQGKTETGPEPVPGVQHGRSNLSPEGLRDMRDPRLSGDPMATPRQETKRKAAGSPATSTSTSTKRARREMKILGQVAHENVAQTPVKRESRPRGSSQTPSTVQRTVSFNEVYQDGKAQYKHQIFEYKAGSGNWYIVKCDDHDVHFKYGNPVHGAAKHVASPQHGNRDKTHDLAIKLLGILVTDCNAELAEMNNREFRRAIDEDGYEVHNRNLLSKSGKLRADERKKHPNSGREGGEIHVNGNNSSKQPKRQKLKTPTLGTVTEPKECSFYQGLWASTKKMYCLITLPIRPDGSLHEVGLRENFHQLPLLNKTPKCYRVDRVSLQIKGWQPAYENGGPKVNKREYPVMYFDKSTPSLGWLHAQKLVELDLENPPADMVDTKGLKKARQWFAEKMNHRKSWDEYIELGPGEPPSTTPNGDGGYQGSFLRSANKQDEDSPRRSRFRGAESVDEIDKSSDADSDDEDPMKMDIGPIPDPEADDSNYIDGSGSDGEGSVGETQEAETQQSEAEEGHDETRPTSRGASGQDQDVDMDMRGPAESRNEVGSAASRQASGHNTSPRSPSPRDPPRNPAHEPHLDKPSDESATNVQESNRSALLSSHEEMRKGVQAKAAEAIKGAASRSRTSSEAPGTGDDGSKAREPVERNSITSQQQPQERPNGPTRPGDQVRPDIQRAGLWDHQRSRSDDVTQTVLATPGVGKLNEGRKPSNIGNLLNPAADGTRTESNENGYDSYDSYKRFDALKAQMESEQPARSASVPVQPNAQPFQPPPTHATKPGEVLRQASPAASLGASPRTAWASPPAQPAAMGPPSSAYSTPVPGLGRSTSTSTVLETPGRWQAVRSPTFGAASQVPRASFINTPTPGSATGAGHGPEATRMNGINTPAPTAPQPAMNTPASTTKAGTPTPTLEKQMVFDVSHFRDQARGVRWSRDSPMAGYLRLIPDPVYGVAHSVGSEGFKAVIEPEKITRMALEIDMDKEKEKHEMHLTLRDGNEQVVVFEANSASGRLLNAKIQGRRFRSWVRQCNPAVEGSE